MGLAPKLNQEQQVKERGGRAPRGGLADVSAIEIIQLRNVVRAIHWTGYKRLLEDIELTLANDRQWMIFRKRVMDLASEKEREMLTAVNRILSKSEQEESNGGQKAR